MLASKQFGCKEFFQSLILVVLFPLSSFVTMKVLLRYPQIQLPGRGPSMQRSTFTTSGSQCMTGPYLHQEIFKKEVHLPSFTLGGDFNRVIQLLSVFSLRRGFPTRFSLFSLVSLFFSIVLVSVLYRVTYGLSFQGPSSFMHFMFSNSSRVQIKGGCWRHLPPYTLILVNLAQLNCNAPILTPPHQMYMMMYKL